MSSKQDSTEWHMLRYKAQIGASYLHPFHQPGTACLLSRLDLAAKGCILEIGCGTGRTMVEVAQHDGVKVVGIDLLPEMVAVARRRLWWSALSTQGKVYCASATALPFPTNFFDAVYLESVIGFQSIPVARSMLAEMHRVLTPGGLLVAGESVWLPGTTAVAAADRAASSSSVFGSMVVASQPWDADAWQALMVELDFTIVEVKRLEDLIRSGDCAAVTRTWRSTLADTLSWVYRLRGLVQPELRQARRRYRRAIAADSESSQALMEACLFVCRKGRVVS